MKIAKARGWIAKKVGTDGWPDYVFISSYGQHTWVEFKREKGARRKRQIDMLEELQRRGVRAYFIETVEFFQLFVVLL